MAKKKIFKYLAPLALSLGLATNSGVTKAQAPDYSVYKALRIIGDKEYKKKVKKTVKEARKIKDTVPKKYLQKFDSIVHKNINIDDYYDPCYRLSLPFLAIAKDQDLSIHAILKAAAITHLYVRSYDEDTLDWDPTYSKFLKDSTFDKETYVSKKALENKLYFEKIGKKYFYSIAQMKGASKDLFNGEYKKAFRHAEKSIKLFPESNMGYYAKGYCYYMKKNYEKALQYAEKAVEKSSLPINYRLKALSLLKLGKYEKAYKASNIANELDPEAKISDSPFGGFHYLINVEGYTLKEAYEYYLKNWKDDRFIY